MNLRPLTAKDAAQAIRLYAALHPNVEIADANHFTSLIRRDDTTVMGAELDGQIIAMATLHLLQNMTHGGRPFGVIENVVTLAPYQNQGIMRDIMNALHTIAWAANAYKIMLMTGSDTGAKSFYEKLGYRSDQKHGLQLRRVPARDGTVNDGTVGGAP